MESEPGKGGPVKAPMINTLLTYVSKPLRPLIEKLTPPARVTVASLPAM